MMNADEREKRLDRILDEVIEKEIEDFRELSLERRKAKQQDVKTSARTENTTPTKVK